jgi:hypothetical protein
MSELKLVHRKQEITFDPATEQWKCGALALADKSLSKLKAAIDKESKNRRRVHIEALYMEEVYKSSRYVFVLKKCAITLLLENDRKANIKIEGKREPQQVELCELFTLDQRSNLEAFIAAKARAEKADAEASEIRDILQPLTASAVREAVAARSDEAA